MNPIELSIFVSRIESICEEMGAALPWEVVKLTTNGIIMRQLVVVITARAGQTNNKNTRQCRLG